MMTKEEMIEIIKAENPSLKTGNDNDGYVEITGQDYDAIIEEWAINRLEILAKLAAEEAQQAEAESKREAALAKLAALGLESDDLKALGL
jgi:hypothetical protein